MASELKVDKFTGVTTAGSILVTGEGNSTTTNLQQGLCKVRVQYDVPSTSNGENITAGDSDNASSLRDDGDGQVMISFTNNMANAKYVINVTGQSQTFGALDENTAATNEVRMETWEHDGTIHNSFGMAAIFGDLA